MASRKAREVRRAFDSICLFLSPTCAMHSFVPFALSISLTICLLHLFVCLRVRVESMQLKVEADIRKATEEGKLTHAIARPTAFFKSLSGQVSAQYGRDYGDTWVASGPRYF